MENILQLGDNLKAYNSQAPECWSRLLKGIRPKLSKTLLELWGPRLPYFGRQIQELWKTQGGPRLSGDRWGTLDTRLCSLVSILRASGSFGLEESAVQCLPGNERVEVIFWLSGAAHGQMLALSHSSTPVNIASPKQRCLRSRLSPPIPLNLPSPLSIVSSVYPCPSPSSPFSCTQKHPWKQGGHLSPNVLSPGMGQEAIMMPRFTPPTFQVWPGA